MHKKLFTAAAIAAALLPMTASGQTHSTGSGQTYPAKPVRMMVGLAPGGGNDTMARLIGQKLSQTLKQQFVVDNRPGASGIIAGELVAKSPPDGYTLLLGNVAMLAIVPNIQKKVA